jgi:hypothetical protein
MIVSFLFSVINKKQHSRSKKKKKIQKHFDRLLNLILNGPVGKASCYDWSFLLCHHELNSFKDERHGKK